MGQTCSHPVFQVTRTTELKISTRIEFWDAVTDGANFVGGERVQKIFCLKGDFFPGNFSKFQDF